MERFQKHIRKNVWLLNELEVPYHTKLKSRGREWCARVANFANLGNIEQYRELSDPVETLLKELHNRGFSLQDLKAFDHKASVSISKGQLTSNESSGSRLTCGSPPSIKFALLIGNKNYQHLDELFTPESDCKLLAMNLKSIGFLTVTILNYTSAQIKACIEELFQLVPYGAYWFIYYAGHGIDGNESSACIMGIDCPKDNITNKSLVSKHFIKREVLSRKPELGIVVYDMCRILLKKEIHPELFSGFNTDEYGCEHNFLEAYATSFFKPALEVNYSSPLNGESMSLYVIYLRKYLLKHKYVREIFDLVHKGIADFTKNDKDVQYSRPVIEGNVVSEHYLTTPAYGDAKAESSIRNYKENLKRLSKNREEEITRPI